MKRILISMVVLLSVLIAGCAPKDAEEPIETKEIETSSPAPSTAPGETPKPSKDKVFDTEGDVILDSNGHFDGDAVMANLNFFSTEELIKLYSYSDGAYSYGITDVLSEHLLNSFDPVISLLANAEVAEDSGGVESLAFHIGTKLELRATAFEISAEDCEVLYSDHDLSEREQMVLNKIIEGYEAEV